MRPVGGAVRGGQAGDFATRWCGWVLVVGLSLTPLMAWLGPMGFAPLVALMGLFSLPAIRLSDEDRPVLMILLLALVWGAISTTWSPFVPKTPDRSLALKLALMLPLYWAAICGARRADADIRDLAERVLAWGLAGLGALLMIESVTGGVIYRAIHQGAYQPIRIDLAQKNIAQTTFVLAVLWPAATIGRLRRPIDLAPLAIAAVGTLVAAIRFAADAPVLAVPLAIAAAAALWRCPRIAPRLMAGKVALIFLLTPAVFWAVRAWPGHEALVARMPLSWAMRVGYWSHALDWIGDHPVRGWGLDASRAMGPGIQLHPHDGPLQLWLELGAGGAVAAAAVWGLSLLRLSRPAPNLAMAGVAGSASAYLLFALINFGVWQEWWLALAAMIPLIAALDDRKARPDGQTAT